MDVSVQWVPAAELDEVPPGHVKVIVVDEMQRIALCRPTEDEYYAIDDVCTHDGGSLDQGYLEAYEIECPRHGARFDVRDGHVTLMPAVIPVATYPVRIEGGQVYVGVPK